MLPIFRSIYTGERLYFKPTRKEYFNSDYLYGSDLEENQEKNNSNYRMFKRQFVN